MTLKFCNGCKRLLPVEQFGIKTSKSTGLTSRCLDCNAEYSRRYYQKNVDRISERKKQYRIRDAKPKPIFIKLEMRGDPEAILKKCPHCGYRVSIPPNQTEGFCHNKGKKYYVKRNLSNVRLEAEFEMRDYEGEILNFIQRKGKTYMAEISDCVNISEGKVTGVLRDLVSNNILTVRKRGKCKWVEINS